MTRYLALPGLDAASYRRHTLHSGDCVWVEKNCYTDVWIELVHALGLDPHAMLAFVLSVDFEGDQWTFFKPSHDDLYDLYGIDVQELTVWRPLLDHAIEHLSNGKLISTEADAFWLPDTAGTDYRSRHTKTSIVLADLDVGERRLGYFHNAGYFSLQGEDFTHVFQLDNRYDPATLPLFAELIRVDRVKVLSNGELIDKVHRLIIKSLSRRPLNNPIARFADRFSNDLPWLQEGGVDHYHLWAFASIRQLGAAFELGARLLTWLRTHGEPGLEPAIELFAGIAVQCKTLILKAARAVNTRRTLDPSDLMMPMAAAWEEGMQVLTARYF